MLPQLTAKQKQRKQLREGARTTDPAATAGENPGTKLLFLSLSSIG